jgi:hypothetical protein
VLQGIPHTATKQDLFGVGALLIFVVGAMTLSYLVTAVL